ncbi:hypothetical protein MMC29_000183 [Sticta canariensis]|nr:hypothetical protein [Sticta canariensis]
MSVPSPHVRLPATSIDTTKQARKLFIQRGQPQYLEDEDDVKSRRYSTWQVATIQSCAELGYIGKSGRSSASAEDLGRDWLKTTASSHGFVWPIACNPGIYHSFISILEAISAR